MQSGSEDTLEELYAIKLCFKLGKNATETYGMLPTIFPPSCMNRASVFECQIKNFMDKNRRVSIETISGQFDVSVGTVNKLIARN